MTDGEKLDLLLAEMQGMKSETLILDEVERVHNILDKHQNDTTKHTA